MKEKILMVLMVAGYVIGGIALMLILCSTMSCQPILNKIEDIHLEGMAEGHNLYYLQEFENLDTHAKIGTWIKAHVNYVRKDIDTWADPEDTIKSGEATCADFAVLYLNIAYFGMGLKGELVCGELSVSKSIEAGGDVDHAQVRFGDTIIEPQNGLVSTMTVGYAYSFDEVF